MGCLSPPSLENLTLRGVASRARSASRFRSVSPPMVGEQETYRLPTFSPSCGCLIPCLVSLVQKPVSPMHDHLRIGRCGNFSARDVCALRLFSARNVSSLLYALLSLCCIFDHRRKHPRFILESCLPLPPSLPPSPRTLGRTRSTELTRLLHRTAWATPLISLKLSRRSREWSPKLTKSCGLSSDAGL